MSEEQHIKPSDRDLEDGTIGFNSTLAGHGKAGKSHTTSFGAGLPDNLSEKTPVDPKTIKAGQEEGGRMRLPTSSAVGRILPDAER